MKICVIEGSPRKNGNGYQLYQEAQKLILKKHPEASFEEFILHKEFNEFCTGCCTCFLKSEEKCPHNSLWKPIVESILNADGIIFLSPSYVLGASAQMKALLDHMGWLFIPHRPDPRMFGKSALIISTAAGAGTKHAAKTIKRSLRYWGVPKVCTAGFNLYSLDIKKIEKKKRAKIDSVIKRKTELFRKNLLRKKIPNPFLRIMLFAMKRLINTYDDDNADKSYWIRQGWIKPSLPKAQ